MKIVVFEAETWSENACPSAFEGHTVVYVPEPLTPAHAASFSDADIVSVFVGSQVDRNCLEQLNNLKLVATRSTGFDHIDLRACREQGVAVTNVPTYGAPTIAEHVFALLLGISHRLVDAVERTRCGAFSYQGLEGFDLSGKTIGVIGTGAIGQCVVRIAGGFGMRVIAHDIAPDIQLADSVGITYEGLETILRESDVVTLHVPLNSTTRSMISVAEFELMKKGVVLINTARGEVIDTPALIDALESGKVAAAGLDVLADEALVRQACQADAAFRTHSHENPSLALAQKLMALRNVLVTPHSAFNTREAIQRINGITAKNITGFIAGSPTNIVS